MRGALISFLLLLAVAAARAAAADELTVKGLTLGDTADKIGLLGVCQVGGRGMCVGKTLYGSAPASFSVTMTAGRVDHIMVTFGAAKSAEVIAGLTAKYGPPNGPTGCKPEARCSGWNSGGLRLTLFEDIGIITLTRAAPADGY
jgi:hypothetical protein